MEGVKQEVLIKELDFYHVFQPIFDLTEGNVHGYEALLRSQAVQNPELLFKYAKKQNQLFDLDMSSIFKACNIFNQMVSHSNEVRLYLNIFPSTLIEPAFYNSLQGLRSIMEINPMSVVLEINEAEKVKDLTALREITIYLKEQGFLIALDDIGKGESSLRSIIELDPDIAKIDRYFAKDLSNSSKKQEILKLMLQLFSDDSTMILEGLESEEDLLTAKKLGVPFAQGFFLGKPKPFEYYLPEIQES